MYTGLLTGGVALGRVFDVVDVPVEVQEAPDAVQLVHVQGRIAFEDVRFRYAENIPVLDHVSFEVPASQ